VDDLLARSEPTARWLEFKTETSGTMKDALTHALRGEFDRACAIAAKEESSHARIFSIKMGALTHSMTKTVAPTLDELRGLVAKLPVEYPYVDLAKVLVGSIAGEIIPADYTRVFRESMKKFEFVNNDEHLMLGFLFLDPIVVEYPEFSSRLLNLYKGRSEVVCSFIEAIEERRKIFDKLYSITSYDGFKDELGIYKSQISSILGSVTWVLDDDLLWELQKEGKGIEIGITASFKLQNYIALLTALTESPVLTITERLGFLEEVLMLYRDYFRGLMKTDIPLFAYTVDSVLQSLSVAHAEYYFLSTGIPREHHLQRTIEFLEDIYEIMEAEWSKARVRFSLFVVANSIGPVLARENELPESEIKLVYAAINLLDVNTVDAAQITRPTVYAAYLSNTNTALTSMATRLLEKDERIEVLKRCVDIALDVQEWFLSFGEVIRDDVMSASFHASLIVDFLDESELKRTVDRVIDLNRIIIQDPAKFDYELAMMSSTLMDLLANAWKRLDDERYLILSRETYGQALAAWKKFGFYELAENFKKKFGHTLET
jgi:hypothetical protein